MDFKDLFIRTKDFMEKSKDCDVIFDNERVYAASTDGINSVTIDNDETLFFNGIQVDKNRGLIVNLDENITIIEMDKINNIFFQNVVNNYEGKANLRGTR